MYPWSRQLRARSVAAFRSSLPTRRRCAAHRQRCLHYHRAGSCCPGKELYKLATLHPRSLSAWSLLGIEKFPDAPAASSGAGFLRSNSLISANCFSRCNLLRQSKKALRTIVGVKARRLLPLKFGVEISIYSPELENGGR